MSFTIIIPAFNEEYVIYETLNSFRELIDNSLVQIIVVCNGCTDNTVKTVKSVSNNILCIETKVGSKTNALNLGDAAANYYPRIYLDADIKVSADAIYAMANTLNNEKIFATSLEPKMDFSGTSLFVKAYYDIWLQLPYCKSGMIGSGVYALSEKGRMRFTEFPNIIADDGFVRCLFNEQERIVTQGFYAIVTAPKNLASLLKIKTRSRLGRYELKAKFPHLLTNENKDYSKAFFELLFNYKLWFKLIVYLSINIATRFRANYQYTHKITQWERDESSRNYP